MVYFLLKNATDDSSIVYFQILVKTLVGKTLICEVNSEMDVFTLKQILEDKKGAPPDQQRLCIGEMILENNRTLSAYNIRPDDTLLLVIRLRGAMYRFTSGRQEFSYMPQMTADAVKNVLALELKDINVDRQSPPDLQDSLIQARIILSTCYHEIVRLPAPPQDTVKIMSIILSTSTENEKSNDTEDDDHDRP